jgi:UDP-3-O-[3-hydroxymyristoyl] glucosamine N-acyltransferase
MTLTELIKALGGTLAQGNPEQLLAGVNSSGSAQAADLVFAEDTASANEALASPAGAVVLRAGLVANYPKDTSVVEAPQPRLWFARAAKLLAPALPSQGIHLAAVVAPDVVVARGVTIAAGAVVESGAQIGAGTRIEAGAVLGKGVKIGQNCRIHPRAVLYAGVTLGDRVIVHTGAVLGADGFGYVRDNLTGAYTQFPQQGELIIEDDVEIGANSTIDRGALATTRIGRGVKIDNLVHIGHNCQIGEDVIVVALTGISGSCTVGKGAVIAGQVGVGDHAQIGPGVILGGQAGVLSGARVSNDGLKPGTVLWGTPARPLKQVLREMAVLSRLAKRGNKDKN